MTNPDLTLIAALLDRSGSMQAIADDTRGGFDGFIAKERDREGTTLVTLAQFDDTYALVYDNKPIDQVPPLILEPRGSTALLDAIGRFVNEIGSGLAALPEDDRPGEVTVLVLTDGHENSSREWTKPNVQQLISEQESRYDWDFVFLGANMDAIDVGTDLGFSAGKSLTYAPSGDGVAGAFASVSVYMDRNRSRPVGSSRADAAFDDADRRRASGSP
jgi:hypothetical protein